MPSPSNPPFTLSPRSAILAATLAIATLLPHHAAAQTPDQRGLAPEQQHAAKSPENGKYYALVIGINTYPAPVPSLKTAENDAQAVATTLHDDYGFDVTPLIGKDATRNRILEAVNRYEGTLKLNDNLLIYYAGHGYENKSSNKAYWLPADSDSVYSANRIIADELTSEMNTIPARHILVISDSCYSGGLSRDADVVPLSNGQNAFLQKMLNGRSRTLMASGGEEPVSDSGAEGHSVFAYALLKSLADQSQSVFTASDLFYGAVQRRVAGNSEQIPQYAIIRNSGNDTGDFVFTRKSASTADIAAKLAAPAPDFNRASALYSAKKYTEALPLLITSCNTGEFRACGGLALMYMQGMGTPVDFVKAAALGKKACDGGMAVACSNLGVLYQNGQGVAQSDATAATLQRKACVGGEPAGCNGLAYFYFNGKGLPRDLDQAVIYYHKSCDDGYATGCENLGNLYRTGKDLPHDDAQAATLYRKACEGDSLPACSYLGFMYQEGQSVGKDPLVAALLYQKSCDGGQIDACASLAVAYEHGQGVAKDSDREVALLQKTCDANYSLGCSYLGNMFVNGTLVTQDFPRAIALYRKACSMKEPISCYNLGMQQEAGNGVTADKDQAADSYARSCTLGDQDGCKAVKRLKP